MSVSPTALILVASVVAGLALLLFVGVMLARLVRAAEGARAALRDLADRFPNMGGPPPT
jgi:hypothetical protein